MSCANAPAMDSVSLSAADDTLVRARNCLRFASFPDPDRNGLAVHVAYILEQYIRLDHNAAAKGGEA